MNEIISEDMAFLENEFNRSTMSETRRRIADHIRETDEAFKRDSRICYLTGKLHDALELAFITLSRYAEAREKGSIMGRIYLADRYSIAREKVRKLHHKIYDLKHPGKKGITHQRIERAKQYPFSEILEFRRGKAVCPFHQDKTPSLHLYPNNRVHCFSCGGTWDTIGFVRERDNLSFLDAVERLSHGA